jgi:hypothetical protein
MCLRCSIVIAITFVVRRRHPARPITDRERREADREADAFYGGGEAVPVRGFCHECEADVDEPAGRLHRPTCKGVPAERRRSA